MDSLQSRRDVAGCSGSDPQRWLQTPIPSITGCLMDELIAPHL